MSPKYFSFTRLRIMCLWYISRSHTNWKVQPVTIFVTADLQTAFRTKFVGIYIHGLSSKVITVLQRYIHKLTNNKMHNAQGSSQDRPRRPRVGVKVLTYSFVNLGAKWSWWSTPSPGSFTQQEIPATHCAVGWVGPRAGLDGCGKSCPHWDSIPGPSSP